MSPKSSAELIKAADELLKKKPARAKAVKATDAAVAASADGAAAEAPKKRAAPKAAAAKTPAKAGAKVPAKAAAKKTPGRKAKADMDGDDADLSDIESELEGEPEAEAETETETDTDTAVDANAAPVEKVKPLRMKISKAKERALMKEFGLDETVLSEEDMAKRRSRLKTLIKLGKTRGYLTHGERSEVPL